MGTFRNQPMVLGDLARSWRTSPAAALFLTLVSQSLSYLAAIVRLEIEAAAENRSYAYTD